MKKRKIEINESILISEQEQMQIHGGDRTRIRTKYDDGTKQKDKYIH